MPRSLVTYGTALRYLVKTDAFLVSGCVWCGFRVSCFGLMYIDCLCLVSHG